MKPIVYVDILFLLNFFANTITIYISFIILKEEIKFWRLALSATFLSIYACIMFFPNIRFMYTVLGKIFALTVSSYIAFPAKSYLKLIKNTIVLFTSCAILGGIAFTLIFATNFGTTLGSAISNGEFYFNIKASTLLISTLIAYVCVYITSEIKKSIQKNYQEIFNISVCFNTKTVAFKGFLDTGCTLCEPISKSSVIIINQSIAKKLLPESLYDFCVNNITLKIPDEFLNKYRIIPYSTIDNQKGYMSGVIPDKVIVNDIPIENTVIAISKQNLFPDESFDAILGTEIYEQTIPHERIHTL